jgi:Zn-dependent membrane protease YugP
MLFWDPTFIVLIPALLLSFYAQSRISMTFNKYLRIKTRSGMTGAETARRILDANGLYSIPIEVTRGSLTDHYDPKHRVLRLSEKVYYGDSIASLGVAAHECGHAVQHGHGYAPLLFRNAIFPVANIGSNLSWIFIVIGFAIGATGFLKLGIILFSAAVLFQIVTLPVEFNASSRAIRLLEDGGILYGEEVKGAKKVLSAAALTYVAATLVAISQLLRIFLLTRDRD